VVPLEGQLFASQADANAQTASDNSDTTSAEYVLQQIEQADADSSIKGVLLRVDSPGGSPVGGEMIANALKALNKPSVAVIWDEGDSAAYLASTGADEIIASPFSDVADIGVTSSYIDQSQKDAAEGLQFIQISAGTYKDTGDPDNPLTPAGKELLQQDVNIDYQTLINEIAKNRSMSVDAIQPLANGASIVGSAALGTGLIDAVGDDATARAWFGKKLNIGANAVLCE
jgi:protease-4